MPMPDGQFSPVKRYEYTYATRKSWEYNPVLRRKDWRYFTTKAFTYAGVWLRRQGNGGGGKWSEVFLDDRTEAATGETSREHTVPWDSDGLLCWRECPYPVDAVVIASTTREIMISSNDNDIKKICPPKPPAANEFSLIRSIFGSPSKCGLFDCAEITTMEAKYRIHDKIAEFWCFVTSIFYGSSLLLYLIKEENWFEGWRAPASLGGWPAYIHFSIVISVLVMICSAVYHISLLEVIGCVDCFLASFIFASVTMTTFGLDILTQVGVLLGIGVLNLYAWRYSTRIALIVVALIYPFAMLSCSRMKSYYGGAVFTLITTGVACFILDRMDIAPLHSLWHILGGGAITLSLYYVVVNGLLE
jgi:hypothetical protein